MLWASSSILASLSPNAVLLTMKWPHKSRKPTLFLEDFDSLSGIDMESIFLLS